MGRPSKQGLKRVKILGHGLLGYEHGKEYDVSEEIADNLCSIGHIRFENRVTPNVRAMLVEDYELHQLEKAEAEATKTVVQTPHDPVFEARIKQLTAKPAKESEEVEE